MQEKIIDMLDQARRIYPSGSKDKIRYTVALQVMMALDRKVPNPELKDDAFVSQIIDSMQIGGKKSVFEILNIKRSKFFVLAQRLVSRIDNTRSRQEDPSDDSHPMASQTFGVDETIIIEPKENDPQDPPSEEFDK